MCRCTMRFIYLSIFVITHSLVKTHDDFRIVCYVDSSSINRHNQNSFDASFIDVNMCTHIVYAFAGIDYDSFTIISNDEDKDFAKTGYESFTNLKEKNPNLKILISIGGSKPRPNYSEMILLNETRAAFIQSTVEFIREHKFDGLDIVWKMPGIKIQMDEIDLREERNLLTEELKTAMPKDWSLSYSIEADIEEISKEYDFKTLSKHVDFFNVLTFDYNLNVNKKIGHNSPLHPKQTDSANELTQNVESSVRSLEILGVPKNKIIVGIPMFGNAFELENRKLTDPGSPSQKGLTFLDYNKICEYKESDGWIDKRDEYQKVPYKYRDELWISYDDPKSVYEKAKFVKENHFGGVMAWFLNNDDFNAKCTNKTKFPLMDAALKGLGKRSVTSDLEPESKITSRAVDITISSILIFVNLIFVEII